MQSCKEMEYHFQLLWSQFGMAKRSNTNGQSEFWGANFIIPFRDCLNNQSQLFRRFLLSGVFFCPKCLEEVSKVAVKAKTGK